MRPDETKAPQAIPALIAGIVAVLLAIFLGPLLVVAAGITAVMLGGVAWFDTRAHGYAGEELAISGMILGLAAIVLSVGLFLL